jgi:hypothetical protein
MLRFARPCMFAVCRLALADIGELAAAGYETKLLPEIKPAAQLDLGGDLAILDTANTDPRVGYLFASGQNAPKIAQLRCSTRPLAHNSISIAAYCDLFLKHRGIRSLRLVIICSRYQIPVTLHCHNIDITSTVQVTM